MVQCCVAFGCNEKFFKGSSVSFHSFPSDENLRKKWIVALRRKNFQPSKHSRLCSKHFTPDCFDTEAFGVSTKLKVNAVPTVFVFSPKTPVKRKAPKGITSTLLDVNKPSTSVRKEWLRRTGRKDLMNKPVLFSSSNLSLSSEGLESHCYSKKKKLQCAVLPTVFNDAGQSSASSGSKFDVTEQLEYLSNDHEYCKMFSVSVSDEQKVKVDDMDSEDVTDICIKEEDDISSENFVNDYLPQMGKDTSFEEQQHHHQTSEDKVLESISIDDVRSLNIQPFTESTSSWDKFPDQICRLCATKDELSPKQSIVRWLALLNEIVPGMVALEDGLPQFICRPCAKKLYTCIELKQQFVEADEILQNTMGFTKSPGIDLASLRIQQSEEIGGNFSVKSEEAQSLIEGTDFTVNENWEINVDDFMNEKSTSEIYITENSDFINNEDNFNIDLMDKKISSSGNYVTESSDFVINNDDGNSNVHVDFVNEEINPSTSNSTFQNILTEIGTNFEEDRQLNYCKSESSSESKYICLTCEDIFTTKDDIDKHLVSHLQPEGLENESVELTTPSWKTEKSENGSEYKHICLTCGDVFRTKDTIAKHLLSHLQPEKLENEHVALATPSWKTEKLESRSEYKHICLTCEEIFTTKDDIDKHLLSHLQPEALENEHDELTTPSWKTEKYYALIKPSSGHIKSQQPELLKNNEQVEITSAWENEKYKLVKPNTDLDFNYVCKKCREPFGTKQLLIEHNKTHKKQICCKECKETFTSKKLFIQHNKIHENPVNLVCEFCDKKFTSKSHLLGHRLIHNKEKSYMCEYCSKSYSRIRELKHHQATHFPPAFPCSECGKMFHRKVLLNAHKRLHTSRFLCEICGKTLSIRRLFENHLLIHAGIKPYQCANCGKLFTTIELLKRHESVHSGNVYSCKICLKNFSGKYGLDKHMNIHNKKKIHECPVCLRGFSRTGNRARHRKTTCTEIFCVVCKLRLSTVEELLEHRTNEHTVEEIKEAAKEYRKDQFLYCMSCCLRVEKSSEMEKHMAAAHGVNSLFKCSQCLRCFLSQDDLTLHGNPCRRNIVRKGILKRKDHLTCKVCQEFVSSDLNEMREHLISVHNDYNPFKCEECSKSFYAKDALKRHIIVHSNERPYACPKCGKRFKFKQGVYQHNITAHQNICKYACPYCERKFKLRSYIKIHVRTHTGEKPFPCPICARRFALKSDMKKHMNTHFGIKKQQKQQTVTL